MDREKILLDAVNTYGESAQMLMMIEEMSELTKAICKYYRVKVGEYCKEQIRNILEEMADVQIMLDQMKIMFGDVRDIEQAKLERLEKRIKESKRGEVVST